MYVPEIAVPPLLRAAHANRSYRTAAGAAAAVRDQELRPRSYHPPRRLRRDVDVAVRRVDGRPVYTITPEGATPVGEVLYVHGGGWMHDVNPMHWTLAARVAVEARTTVTLPVYDLLPYGDAAAAVDLVVGLFEAGVGRGDEVRLAGDSAGGQIALSAALALRDRGHAGIRTVLISPALDLTMTNPEIRRVLPRDPWLGIDGIRFLGERWAHDLAVTDPAVSPLLGDPAGLGPMLLITGTRDVLNPDTHLLATKARSAGVDVTLVEREGAVHVFPFLPTHAGAAGRRRIVDALRQ